MACYNRHFTHTVADAQDNMFKSSRLEQLNKL